MIAVDYIGVKDKFEEYCDTVVHDCETVFVTRKQNENVVIMSESAYNNLIENLYVRSDNDDYQRLLTSINQLRNGKGKARELFADE